MSKEIVMGFVLCMCCDVVFSVCNMFLQQAFKIRAERKRLKNEKKL